MKNILRIFDAWHHSFALISFCVSVAFLIVLTGFLRTGHWLLVLALSVVICAAGLACFWVMRYLADLRRSAILAQTYENCDYGVVISGLDGGVTQVNRAAKEQGFSIEPGSIDRVLPIGLEFQTLRSTGGARGHCTNLCCNGPYERRSHCH
jgi:hypothetical protein